MGEEELRRNGFQVMKDILIACQSGAITTHIVYGANLNFKLLKEYLEKALKSGLVLQIGNRFITTDKGKEFIANVLSLELALVSPLNSKEDTELLRKYYSEL